MKVKGKSKEKVKKEWLDKKVVEEEDNGWWKRETEEGVTLSTQSIKAGFIRIISRKSEARRGTFEWREK